MTSPDAATRAQVDRRLLPTQAILLAAGRGERLRPLTDRIPKPLVEVGGQPLIEHHLQRLRRAGVEVCVINVAHLSEAIERHVGNGSRYGLEVRYSHEPRGALETGGGVLRALELLADAPFLAVNGDTWSDFDYLALANRPAGNAHLVLVPNPPHHPCGDFTLCGSRLGNELLPRLTFSGIAVYRPDLFAALTPGTRFAIAPLLRAAASAGVLTGQLHRGRWHDIGTPMRLAAACHAARSK
jgi:MurNAc alpha-1-phosphate uridylyltransferase